MKYILRGPENTAILKAHTVTVWNVDFGELKISEHILRILLHRECPPSVAALSSGSTGTGAKDGGICHRQGLSASPAPTGRQFSFGDFWQMGE